VAKKRASRKKLEPVEVPLPPRPPTLWQRSRSVVQLLAVCGGALGVLAGLIWLGQSAGGRLGVQARYVVPVEEIRFELPQHLDRRAFLMEVRYISGLGDAVNSADAELQTQLKRAFEAHPWVERVERLDVTPAGEIRLPITYRTAVMQFAWRRGVDVEQCAIDRFGILLPPHRIAAGVPRLLDDRTVSGATVGEPWPEREVLRAGELVQAQRASTIAKTRRGWTLVDGSGKSLDLLTP